MRTFARLVSLLAVVFVCASTAHAQTVDHCAELLRMSRFSARTVMDRSQFSERIRNFCDERRRATSSNQSLDLDLRVLGLGTGSSSSGSTNALATKYCSESSRMDRDDFNYQQYLDGIDPGAYGAYEQCRNAGGVQFQMLSPVTRDVLEVIVFNRTQTATDAASMSWSGSAPVSCQWEALDGEVESPRRRTLAALERTRLRCSRESYDERPIRESDFVNVIRADGGTATISIPWPKYGPDGNPVQTLEEIARGLQNELQAARVAHTETQQDLQALIDRQWRNVSENRNEDECYLNNTGYPIEIAVTTEAVGRGYNFCHLEVHVGGVLVLEGKNNNSAGGNKFCMATVTVPPATHYRVDADGSRRGDVVRWTELRTPTGDVQVVECP